MGVDIAAGPGVDVVCDAYELLDRFGYERFDVLLSTEMIEHVEDWRRVVHNFKHLVRPGGVILITTRSPGFRYHGYPYDFWRFDPQDLARIFDDCEVLAIEADPSSPGAFLSVRKPTAFAERDNSQEVLFSMVAGRKTVEVTARDQQRFRCRYAVKRFLRRFRLRTIWKILRGEHSGHRS